jgi:hypothetical protein
MPNLEKVTEPIFSKSFIQKLAIAVRATAKITALTSDTDRALADSILKDAKALRKGVEEIRFSFSRPLDEKKKELLDLEKSVAKDIDAEITRLNNLINSFLRQQHQEAEAEKQRILQEQEAALKRLRSPNSIAKVQEAAEEAIAAVAAPTSGVRMVSRFKVTDLSLVPRNLLMIDEAAVKDAISKGMISCVGLEIWQEPVRSGR